MQNYSCIGKQAKNQEKLCKNLCKTIFTIIMQQLCKNTISTHYESNIANYSKKLWKNYANMHPEKWLKFMNYKVMGNKLCKLTDITHLTQKLRKHPKITRFTYSPLCSVCRWINDNQWRFQVRASCQVYFQV